MDNTLHVQPSLLTALTKKKELEDNKMIEGHRISGLDFAFY